MKELYVVGIGPGKEAAMTKEAAEVMDNADIIVGYTTYIDIIRDKYPDKELVATPMRQEKERCKMALDMVNGGDKVALVCSGDAGVYGLASLTLELAADYADIEVKVVPGVTAALSGSAILGAPLSHDFCVISLSDLLTPWDVIDTRLRAAAMGDFCIALYNPSSHKRADYLSRACDILMEYASPETKCGYVQNIGREGECYKLCTLRELRDEQVDMFTTVFIGNSKTVISNNRLITPRGYRLD